MKIHPVSKLFPEMDEQEFESLKDDIRRNGLKVPILISDDRVADGKNRLRACRELGIKPRFEKWSNGQSLLSHVVSLNLARRHLTPSQKAALAVELLPRFEEEAKARQKGGRGGKLLSPKLGEAKAKSADHACNTVGVSRGYVEKAKALKAAAPALFAEVKSGQKTLTEATAISRRTTIAQKVAALPKGKFRVIYADPPWSYGDVRNGLPSKDSASRHYPTMSLEDICAMPVRELAQDDSVLFLWVTSPLLPNGLRVMQAWGFEYKASFVWDKGRRVYGHYNGVQHEFLLVGVRGSCTPDHPEQIPSVIRAKSSEHSKKPDEFISMIETLYRVGARVELFARRKRAGWEAHGKELD